MEPFAERFSRIDNTLLARGSDEWYGNFSKIFVPTKEGLSGVDHLLLAQFGELVRAQCIVVFGKESKVTLKPPHIALDPLNDL